MVYFLISLKCIEILSPDSVSFIDKDGIDDASTTAVEFYCMINLLTRRAPWSEKEKDFIIWMLYAPASFK